MISSTGAICILAYPEEFVSMIPAWYRKPMEWVGMVHNGLISAGHSAMALINKETGEIFYADFGRYITELGKGRTRMKFTDPDVDFSYKVEFDENGKIIDKHALFREFYNNPHKTHGGPVMYVSINEEIDFHACYNHITDMNSKGSIIYDPFGKGRSNCSRFVFDAILAGLRNNKMKRRLKSRSPITSSPLGNVFHGTQDEAYKYTAEGFEKVRNTSIVFVSKHLFRKPDHTLLNTLKNKKEVDLGLPQNSHIDFLDGLGDQAYIELVTVEDTKLKVNKYDKFGELTFTKWYRKDSMFDESLPFQFVHDCNALWITIKQNGVKMRMDCVTL